MINVLYSNVIVRIYSIIIVSVAYSNGAVSVAYSNGIVSVHSNII